MNTIQCNIGRLYIVILIYHKVNVTARTNITRTELCLFNVWPVRRADTYVILAARLWRRLERFVPHDVVMSGRLRPNALDVYRLQVVVGGRREVAGEYRRLVGGRQSHRQRATWLTQRLERHWRQSDWRSTREQSAADYVTGTSAVSGTADSDSSRNIARKSRTVNKPEVSWTTTVRPRLSRCKPEMRRASSQAAPGCLVSVCVFKRLTVRLQRARFRWDN